MPSKALSMGKLLGSDGNIPTAKLPTNIQSLDVAGMASISSNLTGAGKISIKSLSANSLTQSFDSGQEVNLSLSDSVIANSPIVSVFKEVEQTGISSKLGWDVNSNACLLYTSPSPRDKRQSRMPSSA